MKQVARATLTGFLSNRALGVPSVAHPSARLSAAPFILSAIAFAVGDSAFSSL